MAKQSRQRRQECSPSFLVVAVVGYLTSCLPATVANSANLAAATIGPEPVSNSTVIAPNCPLDCMYNTTCEKGPFNITGHPVDPVTGAVYSSSVTNYQGWSCACPPGYTGIRCGRVIPQCNVAGSEKCVNGGSCMPGIDQYANLQYYCDCSTAVNITKNNGVVSITNYVGQYCEKKVENYRRCNTPNTSDVSTLEANAYCTNGGICRNPKTDPNPSTIDKFPCTCPDGYIGAHCEYNEPTVTDCDLECGENGVCRLGTKPTDSTTDPYMHWAYTNSTTVAGKYCECRPGYVGPACEYTYETCGHREQKTICLNGAACVTTSLDDGSTAYSCDCTSISHSKGVVNMYAGTHCQYSTNKLCSGSDSAQSSINGLHFCVNHGTCPSSTSSHSTCSCSNGFGGSRCEYTPHEVSSGVASCKKQCQNNGVCRHGFKHVVQDDDILSGIFADKNETRYCACPSGWSGPNCELSYQYCPDGKHVCFSGSTCTKHGGSTYTCNCSTANTLSAGEFCQHRATDTCANPSKTATRSVASSVFVQHNGFCVNGGTCGSDSTGTFCSCDETKFTGPHCENEVVAAHTPTPAPTHKKSPSHAATNGPVKVTSPTASPTRFDDAFHIRDQKPLNPAMPPPVDISQASSTTGGGGSGGGPNPGAVFGAIVVSLVAVVAVGRLVYRRRLLKEHGIDRSGEEETFQPNMESWQPGLSDKDLQPPTMPERTGSEYYSDNDDSSTGDEEYHDNPVGTRGIVAVNGNELGDVELL